MMIIMVEHQYKHTPRVAEQKESWWVPIITATYFPPTHSLILMHVVCDEWVRSLLPFFFFFSSSNPPLYSTHPHYHQYNVILSLLYIQRLVLFSSSTPGPLYCTTEWVLLPHQRQFNNAENPLQSYSLNKLLLRIDRQTDRHLTSPSYPLAHGIPTHSTV